ncbi:MAG: TIM44-like domain-containing protein [Myxococcales bacterium]|nr:TIM44-like domain-containing protein [Myxococcales bacterium]
MSRRITTVTPALVALVVVAAALAEVAEARPGGGQSYSGGGSSSGGGGGGDAELIFLLIRLIFYYPKIGIPLLLIVVVVLYFKAKGRLGGAWQSPAAAAAPRPGGDLSRILALDPQFSPIVFEDFVYRLYASAHQARRVPADLAALAPYLDDGVREALAERQPANLPITNVVIGAMKALSVSVPGRAEAEREDAKVVIRLSFEANMSTAEHTYYVEEIWTLARAASARSRPPEKAEVLGCPHCGAPFTSSDNQRCDYCGEVVSGGRFDWQVTSIQVVRQDERPPVLTQTVAEVGTDLPTIIDPNLRKRWDSLAHDDPALSVDSLRARVEMIFRELNAGWSALDAPRLRPYVSDGMFDYLRYWIDAYRRQSARNVVDDAAIRRVLLVKVSRDRYYDAVTVRVYAGGHDYTIDARGKVISGSKRRVREYSEYWTLIRGSSVRGAARADANCPQCGAGLKVSMAGACEYCGAHITRGEFDWVLSKIEQDESYGG